MFNDNLKVHLSIQLLHLLPGPSIQTQQTLKISPFILWLDWSSNYISILYLIISRSNYSLY